MGAAARVGLDGSVWWTAPVKVERVQMGTVAKRIEEDVAG
jgi:hypothetical protein